ncbi:hypothetical protein PT974_07834 [Cladobotryum mycophilum]|uniref:Uncharacterized protein n=1 Tax=Cladobotryum mycophilum TaxID=491253 RepID=A0ABR0SJ60_9HYPO
MSRDSAPPTRPEDGSYEVPLPKAPPSTPLLRASEAPLSPESHERRCLDEQSLSKFSTRLEQLSVQPIEHALEEAIDCNEARKALGEPLNQQVMIGAPMTARFVMEIQCIRSTVNLMAQ